MATIFPSNPTVGQVYQGYEWNGTAWIVIGIDLTEDYATQTYVDNAIAGFETLPNQTNNSGKFLKTDGTSPLWDNVSIGNIDGGFPDSVYGGVSPIDAGGVV